MANNCHYSSGVEIENGAQKVLQEFSTIESFDEFYHFMRGWKSDPFERHFYGGIKRDSLEKRRKALSYEVKNSSEALVKSILDQYKKHPALRLLNREDFLNPNFVPRNDMIFSTYDGEYTVRVSKHHLSAVREALDDRSFETFLKGALAHEISHYIYDINFEYNRGGYEKNLKYNHEGSPEYLKYHLMIDAVAAQLSGFRLDEYVLSTYQPLIRIVQQFGEQDLSKELSERVLCLEEFSKTTQLQ